MTHIFGTRRGRMLRDQVVERDAFTCQMCGTLLKMGRDSDRSAVVDHIIPVFLAPELERDPENLRTVCKSCHDGPCQAIERRCGDDREAIRTEKMNWSKWGYDETGRPTDPSHPWNAA